MNRNLLSNMILLATNAHAGQFDKGGKPYILHCLTVMHKVSKITDDEELLAIAVGHDLIEDTDTTYEALYSLGCTARVVEGIKALTKQRGQTYSQYQEEILRNKDACIVKMADLTHNSDLRRLKGVAEKDLKRIVKYAEFYNLIKETLERENF